MTESIKVGDTVRVITPDYEWGGLRPSVSEKLTAGDVFTVDRIDAWGNAVASAGGAVHATNVELVRPSVGFKVGDTVRVVTPEFLLTGGRTHRSVTARADQLVRVYRVDDDGNLAVQDCDTGHCGLVAAGNVELVRPADGFKPGDRVRIVNPIFRYGPSVRTNDHALADRIYVVCEKDAASDHEDVRDNVVVAVAGIDSEPTQAGIFILPEGLELAPQERPRQILTGHVYAGPFNKQFSRDWLDIGEVSKEAMELFRRRYLPEAPKKRRPTWADVREGDIVTAEGEIYMPGPQVSYNAVLTGPALRIPWANTNLLRWFGNAFGEAEEREVLGTEKWTILEIEKPAAEVPVKTRPLAERRKPRRFQLLRNREPVWIWQGFTRKAVGEGVVENGVLIINDHTEVDIHPDTDTLQLRVEIGGTVSGDAWVDITHDLDTAETITHEEA